MGKPRDVGLFHLSVIIFLVFTITTCLGAGNLTVGCFANERFALLKFKDSVTDYGSRLSSWVGSDCCLWFGVGCDSASGRVVSLRLKGSRFWDGIDFHSINDSFWYLYMNTDFQEFLGGKVNSALSELTQLNYLDLSLNDFLESRIPEFIGSLKQLRYLNLSYSNFADTIPHHLGNLSNLNVLDLGSNWLAVDDLSWVSGLSSLRYLDLSEVLFIGETRILSKLIYTIPSLLELHMSQCGFLSIDVFETSQLNSSSMPHNIKHLDLSSNFLNGPLPNFFRNMTSLLSLDLSSYSLSQPHSFLKLCNMIPSLTELYLKDCDLLQMSPIHVNFSKDPKLQHLDLGGNYFEGEFPASFMNMSSLRSLDLSHNFLDSYTLALPNLLTLDLSYNNIDHIENTGMWKHCHLKQLRVAHNQIQGEIIGSSTNISQCSKYTLVLLDLSANQFTGSIPMCLEKLTSLETLYLDSNQLTGYIPISLGKLVALKSLSLDWNKLNGSIPEYLGRLASLQMFSVSSNELSGTLPLSMGQLTKLMFFDVSHNLLEGALPSSMVQLSKLMFFDVSSNSLQGALPSSMWKLTRLKFFDVSNNSLEGALPTSMGKLTKLVVFDVSNNSFEGVVCETVFSNLSMLKYLYATSNLKLTFNFSRKWLPMFQLRRIRMSSCKIAGEFPSWIRTQKNLEELQMSNANISGRLPSWMRNMSTMPMFDLSHNQLTGPLTNIPCSKKLWRGIAYSIAVFSRFSLNLNNNLFNGPIPKSLCKWTEMLVLDLSNNRLSGEIPHCLFDLPNLNGMVLNSNKLFGFIPNFTGSVPSSLRWLSLNNNKLKGKLPISLGKLIDLRVLDLGDNNLSGRIPKWIGDRLIHLVILRLRKNNFTGRIPQSLCNKNKLNILDIAHNNITGGIPRCFKELRGMVKGSNELVHNGNLSNLNVLQIMKGQDLAYTTNLQFVINLDLSSNKLVGEIPEELTTLSMLVGLNLSHNNLNGCIPNSIGSMKALISLDFSENELTGMIPSSLSDLNFLSYLNLSHNNLSGRIPTGNQLQTLVDPSIYVGNRFLCGAPLPNNCSNNEDTSSTTIITDHKAANEPKKVWFYLDIMCGFATGFWGIIGVLVFKKQWRHKLFMFAELTMDKIHVLVAVRVSKMKRRREVA